MILFLILNNTLHQLTGERVNCWQCMEGMGGDSVCEGSLPSTGRVSMYRHTLSASTFVTTPFPV